MKIGIKTYGCTLNQADSDIIRSVLESGGHTVVESGSPSDVIVINTCTVKNGTAQKILYKLKNLDRAGKRVIVTGCMAGANRDLIAKHAPHASIMTTQSIGEINSVITDVVAGKRIINEEIDRINRIGMLSPQRGLIAHIPVSDGCMSACSFCETKFARGPLNSFNESTIIKAVERSVQHGAREIQLTAQDMGAYGFDRKTDVAELMEKIAKIDGDFIVRIGMLNPEHLDRYVDRLCDIIRDRHFYRFLHLPVQSGSDSVLKAMKRNYSVDEFKSIVKRIRKSVSGMGIATDLIVGFPGESEDDFAASCAMVEDLEFEVTNISRFGARPHASASMMEQHDSETINRRSNDISRVVRRVQNSINKRYIGRNVMALFTELGRGSVNGRTLSYRQVVARRAPESILGARSEVIIDRVSANAIYGNPVPAV